MIMLLSTLEIMIFVVVGFIYIGETTATTEANSFVTIKTATTINDNFVTVRFS